MHPAELLALLKMRAVGDTLENSVTVASLYDLAARFAIDFFRRIAQQGFRCLVPDDDALLSIYCKQALGSVGKLFEELGDWLGILLR